MPAVADKAQAGRDLTAGLQAVVSEADAEVVADGVAEAVAEVAGR